MRGAIKVNMGGSGGVVVPGYEARLQADRQTENVCHICLGAGINIQHSNPRTIN
uniref:Uncharacterized protein n=1 Tax=Anguilla anguilla TaxID=7936 RepID=A0A0E9XF13_ANGAN